MARAPLFALLTDFGVADGYAGVLHGVLARHCPAARVIDITHQIPRHSVDDAAFVLWSVYRHFPPRTIFACVVDPGVGTARGLLALRTPRGQRFVAPDNGLLRYVLADEPCAQGVHVCWQDLKLRRLSQTFHGRDVIAPAAAALARGVALKKLGPVCALGERAEPLAAAPPVAGREWHPARIVHADQFGNLITNVPTGTAVARLRVRRRVIARRVQAYADGAGTPLCIVPGSAGMWEIAAWQASAQEIVQAGTGTVISFSLCAEARR